jgi:hypothetical protein
VAVGSFADACGQNMGRIILGAFPVHIASTWRRLAVDKT